MALTFFMQSSRRFAPSTASIESVYTYLGTRPERATRFTCRCSNLNTSPPLRFSWFDASENYSVMDLAKRDIPIGIWVGTEDQFFALRDVRVTRDALQGH